MNAFLGNEGSLVVTPSEKPKKVMVVGGGPAGMEAARVAAERGHSVTIYDKARELGGLLPMAAFIKGTSLDDLNEAIGYYETQLAKLGVQVQLGTEVTPELVQKVKPDVVILAPGGIAVTPEIPIQDGSRVVTTEQLKGQAKEFVRVLGSKWMSSLTKIFLPVGKKVVVVGGDLAGLEAAEFLVKRSKEVVIVDEAPQIGDGMLIHWLIRLMPWLAAKNVPTYAGVQYKAITPQGLTFVTAEGEEKTVEADTIMIVNRYKKNAELYDRLLGLVPEVHLIGDAKEDRTGYIRGAIHDGARIALSI
jgi:2,4-dienoyl-CoA reductase (NADPH2)